MKGIVVGGQTQGVIGRIRMELPDAAGRAAAGGGADPGRPGAWRRRRPSWTWRSGPARRPRRSPGSAGCWASAATPRCGSRSPPRAGGRSRPAGTTDIDREIEPGDPLDRVLGVIASADSRAIQETAARLDLDQVARVADAIAAAGPGGAVRPRQQRHRGPRDGVPAGAHPGPGLAPGGRAQGAHQRGPARARRRRDRAVAQRPHPRGDRGARRGGLAGRADRRGDLVRAVAAGRGRRRGADHGRARDDVPAGGAVRAALPAGRARPHLRRGGPAHLRAHHRGVRGDRPRGAGAPAARRARAAAPPADRA